MKKLLLYSLWGCLFVLCVGLGTIQVTDTLVKTALLLIGVVFFVPGAILLYDAKTTGDRKGILTIRWISITSLTLTLGALLAFLLTSSRGIEAADVLFEVLILVSSPMICSQYWLVSLFLWSCLLSATFIKTPRDQM